MSSSLYNQLEGKNNHELVYQCLGTSDCTQWVVMVDIASSASARLNSTCASSKQENKLYLAWN